MKAVGKAVDKSVIKIGNAANYAYDNNAVAKYAFDNPIKAGAAIGVAAGVVVVGGVIVAGGTITCGALCGPVAGIITAAGTQVDKLKGVVGKVPGKTGQMVNNPIVQQTVIQDVPKVANGLKNVSQLASEVGTKIAGKGSTGRTLANSLKEQEAMRKVLTEPNVGTNLNQKGLTMSDPRWPATDGWIKMARNINGVELHWLKNSITGFFDDFKFRSN